MAGTAATTATSKATAAAAADRAAQERGANEQPVADEPVADEPVPANRAERRAKGKKTVPEPHFNKIKVSGRRGPISAARNFATRRSG